jgi:hypothetical protein
VTLKSDLCGRCHHTVDLHELTEMGFRDSLGLKSRIALRWKFRCHELGCNCINFTLDERP